MRVVPTLLEAAGGSQDQINTGVTDAEGYTGFDGSSFWSVVTQENKQHGQYAFGVQTTRGIFSGSVCYPIRSVRSEDYKLILNLNSSSKFYNTVNTSKKGIYRAWIDATEEGSEERGYVMKYMSRPKEELYDIRKDPYEMNNLAGNPKYAEIKEKLAIELKKWMSQQGDRGIDTELKAIQRQPRWDEEGWNSYEEQQNNTILEGN